MVMRGVIWASLLLVSLPDRGEGGGWYTHRPKLTVDYLHGPLADSLSRYRGFERGEDESKEYIQLDQREKKDRSKGSRSGK
jgi:hypothetical protein